jgi:hypothetical protein
MSTGSRPNNQFNDAPVDAKNPFTGQVILKNGNLAKDLAYYYLESEQIPTAFRLGIFSVSRAFFGEPRSIVSGWTRHEGEAVQDGYRTFQKLSLLRGAGRKGLEDLPGMRGTSADDGVPEMREPGPRALEALPEM